MRRSRITVVVVALAATFVLGSALPVLAAVPNLSSESGSVSPEVPPLTLIDEAPGTVHLLSPGETTLWNVGVTTHVATLESLVGVVEASGTLVLLPQSPTTISLFSCQVPWQDELCAQGQVEVLAPTSLGQLAPTVASLTDETPPLPANVYVQTRMALEENAPNSVQGAHAIVRLTVTASGETLPAPAPPVSGPPGLGRPDATLPHTVADTGSRVLGFGLLASLAVLGGIGIAAAARLQHEREDRK